MNALGLALATLIAAESPHDAMLRYFRAGEQAYQAGRFEVAITAFNESNAIEPSAAVRFSMAQAYRRQYYVDRDDQKLARAIELYKRYLAEAGELPRKEDAARHLASLEPLLALSAETHRRLSRSEEKLDFATRTQLMVTSTVAGARGSLDGAAERPLPLIEVVRPGAHQVRVTAAGHDLVERNVTALEARLVVTEVDPAPRPALVQLEAPAGSTVLVNDVPRGETPLAGPLQLAAGTSTLVLVQRGRHPWSRELTVAPGDALSVTAEQPFTGQRRAAIALLGSGAAAAVGGSVFTGLAAHAWSVATRLDDQRMREGLTAEQAREYLDQRQRWSQGSLTAAVLLTAGAALLLAGTLLALFDSEPATQAARAAPVAATARPDDSEQP